MAQTVLIMGESGTGKSTSLRNCDPAITAVVNPVGKALPFRGSARFETLDGETDAGEVNRFIREQVARGKKLIVVDDFQYILSVPYMQRIKESGWDKWNDFGANYFEIIQVCKELPEHVVVAYLTHTETLESGVTTIKLIGKLLREKITIEGLFSIVLRTGVNEGKYYFYTQNSGKDTVKSPMGMFPSYAIENDLNYVYEKILNYYGVGCHMDDEAMAMADAEAAADVPKPEARKPRRGSAAKTREEVKKENAEKEAAYAEALMEAAYEAAGDDDAVPFDVAAEAMDKVPKPDLEPVPRRTRKQRAAAASAEEEPAGLPAQAEEAASKPGAAEAEKAAPARRRRRNA